MVPPTYSTLRATHLACLYAGLTVTVLGASLYAWSGDDFPMFALVCPGLLAMLWGAVCGMWLLHRSWSCLERHAKRFPHPPRLIDPTAAVVMTVTPLVNIVGVFLSLGRLPGALNEVANSAGLRARADASMGYLVGVLALFGVIPRLGWVFALIAGLVLLPMTLFACSKVAEAIETRSAELESSTLESSSRPTA